MMKEFSFCMNYSFNKTSASLSPLKISESIYKLGQSSAWVDGRCIFNTSDAKNSSASVWVVCLLVHLCVCVCVFDESYLLDLILTSFLLRSWLPSLYQLKEGLGLPTASHLSVNLLPSRSHWESMGFTFGADATDGENRQRVSRKEMQVCPKDRESTHFFLFNTAVVSHRQQWAMLSLWFALI